MYQHEKSRFYYSIGPQYYQIGNKLANHKSLCHKCLQEDIIAGEDEISTLKNSSSNQKPSKKETKNPKDRPKKQQ